MRRRRNTDFRRMERVYNDEKGYGTVWNRGVGEEYWKGPDFVSTSIGHTPVVWDSHPMYHRLLTGGAPLASLGSPRAQKTPAQLHQFLRDNFYYQPTGELSKDLRPAYSVPREVRKSGLVNKDVDMNIGSFLQSRRNSRKRRRRTRRSRKGSLRRRSRRS